MVKKKPKASTPIKYKKLIENLLSVINHDFRSPAASIKNATDILEKNLIDDPETKKDFVCMISNENNYLIELIKDIITATKIDFGLQKWDFETVELKKLVSEINENCSCLIQRKQQTLRIEDRIIIPVKVKIDTNRIIQVFEILISNASKFSGNEKEILITFDLISKKSKKILEVNITDNGIGISKDIKPFIFKKLDPHKYPANRPKGTGAGLYVAKKIIEAHKGTIKFISEDGKGTTFIINLPIKT